MPASKWTKAAMVDAIQSFLGDNDRVAAGSVSYTQTRDVHPPLYYWLLNFVSSLVPGHFSMWIGLALNYVLYMLTLVLLYKLAMLEAHAGVLEQTFGPGLQALRDRYRPLPR